MMSGGAGDVMLFYLVSGCLRWCQVVLGGVLWYDMVSGGDETRQCKEVSGVVRTCQAV